MLSLPGQKLRFLSCFPASFCPNFSLFSVLRELSQHPNVYFPSHTPSACPAVVTALPGDVSKMHISRPLYTITKFVPYYKRILTITQCHYRHFNPFLKLGASRLPSTLSFSFSPTTPIPYRADIPCHLPLITSSHSEGSSHPC